MHEDRIRQSLRPPGRDESPDRRRSDCEALEVSKWTYADSSTRRTWIQAEAIFRDVISR